MPISAAKTAKVVSYSALLLAVPGWFLPNGKWGTISAFIVFVLLFLVGAFHVFASEQTIMDYWGVDSQIGRAMTDGNTNKAVLGVMRFLGIAFMVGTILIGVVIGHNSAQTATQHRTQCCISKE